MSDHALPTLEHEIRSVRREMRVLTWGLGITAGVLIALLGTMLTMAYQLGEIGGQLNVLIGHVQMK